MRYLRPILALLVCGILFGDPAKADPYRGILEWCDDCDSAPECPGGVHWLTDLCSGSRVSFSNDAVLPFVCRHINLEGFICPSGRPPPIWINPMTVVETVPVCTNEIRQLAVGGGADAALSWDRRPCASSYDVIRGEITPGSAGGSIGIVTCIANDFLGGDVTHTFMAGPHDAEIPAEGHAFFYLVRANGEPFGGDTYGQGSDGAERLPVAGDCPP